MCVKEVLLRVLYLFIGRITEDSVITAPIFSCCVMRVVMIGCVRGHKYSSVVFHYDNLTSDGTGIYKNSLDYIRQNYVHSMKKITSSANFWVKLGWLPPEVTEILYIWREGEVIINQFLNDIRASLSLTFVVFYIKEKNRNRIWKLWKFQVQGLESPFLSLFPCISFIFMYFFHFHAFFHCSFFMHFFYFPFFYFHAFSVSSYVPPIAWPGV